MQENQQISLPAAHQLGQILGFGNGDHIEVRPAITAKANGKPARGKAASRFRRLWRARIMQGIFRYFEVNVQSKAIALTLLLFVGPGGGAAWAKSAVPDDNPVIVAQSRRHPPPPQEEDESMIKIRKEQEKKMNEQRFADLKRDTDKLLKLSTELKEFVDKANKETLSLDVIRKADEIEKLAKSVREKMRGY
jgi:hypothetical protein